MMNRDLYSHGSLPGRRPTNRRMQPMARRGSRLQPMARLTTPTSQMSQSSFVLGNRQEVLEDNPEEHITYTPSYADEGNSDFLYDPEEYGYDDYEFDYGDEGYVDDGYDNDDEFSTILAHVRESMKPCCPECVSRRAEIVHMLLQANPGTINHVFALFELAGRETLDELVAIHPGTRLERHQFHYEIDRVVYEDSLSSSEDFTSRFVVGPSPMPRLFVVEFDDARAAQLQRLTQPPPSNPPARAIRPGLVAQPRIAAEQGRPLARPGPLSLALPTPPPPSNLPTRSSALIPPTIQPAEHTAAPQVASSEFRPRRRGARGKGGKGSGQAPQRTQGVFVAPTSNSRQLTLRPAPSRAAPQAAPQVNAQAPPPAIYQPGTTGLRPAAPKQAAAAPVAVPAATPAATAPTQTAGAPAPALAAPTPNQAAAPAGAAPAQAAAPPVAAAPQQATAPAAAAPKQDAAAAATTQQATPAPENRDVPSLEKRKEIWDRTRGRNIPTLESTEPYTWHLPDRQFNWKACVGGPRGMVQVVQNWTPLVRLFQRQWQPGNNTSVTEFVLGPSDDRLWGSNAFEFMLNRIFDIMAVYSHRLLKLDGDMDFASFFEDWFADLTRPTDKTTQARMGNITAINEGTENLRTRNKRVYAEARRILMPLIQQDPKEKEHVKRRLFEWVYGPKDALWADVKEDVLIRAARGVWVDLAQSAGDTTTVAYINREFHRQSYSDAARSQPGRQTHS